MSKVLSLREMLVEYILFCYDEEALQAEYSLSPEEVSGLGDVDLLEMYDATMFAFG